MNGGSIVFPTETLYGLGAVATNKRAVRKIYLIKGRSAKKLLPVIVGSIGQAKRYFILNRDDLKLMRRFWPGPLSLILKTKSKKLIDAIGSDTLAVRLSSSKLARDLATFCDAPIVSTSANISGQPGCFTISAVKRQLLQADKSARPDLFINGGKLIKSLPSTIISTSRHGPLLIREGKIKFAAVTRTLRS